MEEKITKAMDFVLNQKARYADIRLEKAYGTVIELRDGVIREMAHGIDEGTGVRVLYENSWGFSSSTETLKLNIKETAENALHIGKALSVAKVNKLKEVKMAETRITKDKFMLKVKIDPEDVDIEEKKEVVKEAYIAAKEKSTKIKSIYVLYMDGYEEKIYANSEGTYITIWTPAIFLRVRAVARAGNILQEGQESIGAIAGFEVIKEEKPEVIGLKAANKAVRLLGAKMPPAGEFPVIMDPKLTGVFMHEALGHASEADHVLCGESILSRKLGSKIAYEGLNVVDDPCIENSYGYYRYDDEGVRAKRTEIIKKGFLVSFLHTRETAGILEGMPTGNARASDYSEIPIVRMSNIVVESEDGGWSFKEMLEDVNFGIYAKGMRGGQVDTVRGEFQFSAEEAFLIEKGVLSKILKNVSLSGRTLEVLKKIECVGKDKKRGSIGFCGKEGQEVPVSEYSPHVKVEEILIGGSSS